MNGRPCYGKSIIALTAFKGAQWKAKTKAGTAIEIDGEVVVERAKMR